MRKTRKTKGKTLLSLVVASALMLTGSLSSVLSASAAAVEKGNLASGGKYYTDYNTKDEAMEAALDLNLQIAAEGMVLLKNNGALPLETTNYVSVFGVREDSLTGGSGSIHASLEKAGFRVNPKLASFYGSNNNAIGAEVVEFDPAVESSFTLYKDAAVVLFSRTGGEGSDPTRITGEINNDEDNVNGWEHVALAKDPEGQQIKHYFQLTDSENELLDYVKARFGKVVVVLNSSSIMEMYNLENDDRIDGLISMDRPGDNGVEALGGILSGAINPSAKTADTWYRDFSADPTWYNFGNNAQTSSYVEYKNTTTSSSMGGGSQTKKDWVGDNTSNFSYMGNDLTQISGVSYEEGIYFSYKYYETVWAEIEKGSVGVKDGILVKEGGAIGKEAADKWYNDNVVYPFGFGLSYTTFEMEMGEIYYELNGQNVALSSVVEPALFESSVAKGEAKVETLYAPVTVKNTGKVAGKQVVQIYVTAPYTAGEVEKSHVKLVGFGKTDLLAPGAEQTIIVNFNVQDFASFDYTDANKNGAKTYELDEGAYAVKLMSDSHNVVDEFKFEISGDKAAVVELDDYTGNKVGATDFSNPNSEYYTLINPEVKFSAGEPQWKDQALYGETASMTIMSRADFAGTFPKHEAEDYVLTKSLLEYLDKYCATKSSESEDLDNENAKWYLTAAELEALMAGWTQADNAAVNARQDGMCEILLREMAGVPFYAEDGTTINPKWTAFMNQLSFDEIVRLITQCSQSSPSIPSIGKLAARNIDGPNSTAGMKWFVESGIGCTWNVELSYKQGVMVGNLYTLAGYTSWYAPAINMHRSPFGGRNNEYYSSDGIHAGAIAAAAAYGCESRGVNCYLKHFALNDQETARTNLVTFADEQNIRENYLIPFQMAVQEGKASALMLTFSRIGIVPSAANYVFIQEITRDEWGFTGVVGTDFFPYRQSGFTVGTEGEDDYFKFVGGNTTVMDTMIRAGGVHPLGNGSDLSAKWNDETKQVEVNGKYAPIDYYYARLFATRICYVYANSVNIDNGIVFGQNYTFIYDYVDKTRQPQPDTRIWELEAGKVGVKIEESLAATEYELGEGNVAKYSVVAGELPAGLSFNATTGMLSGIPTEAGQYEFTVRATIDRNYGEAIVKLNIADAMYADGGLEVNLLDENADNDAFDLWIDYEEDTIANAQSYTSFKYTAEGLPAGVTISEEGQIVGVPTEAGVFNVKVILAASYTSGRNTVTDNYYFNLTLTVTGVETVEGKEVLSFEINENGELIVTYTDETTANLGKVVGADGQPGEKGEQGEQGPQGIQGPQGEPGAAAAAGCKGELGVPSIVMAIVALGACALVLRKKED